jgi:orotate phosphoribosyltransferase
METEKKIAQALLQINAVGFCVEDPITFSAGLKAPVYVDNRKFPFWPEQWHEVIRAFAEKLNSLRTQVDVIAGIETAGIPHSSALAFVLQKPSVFVRKKPKEHGTKSKIEGKDTRGKHTLLIEDLVTTGQSSLAGVEALREAGAIVEHCFVIVTYGFPEVKKAFEKANVQLHALTSFPAILEEANISVKDKQEIANWLEDPYGWRN